MDSAAPLSPTGRTQLRRLRERARTDRGELYAILDEGMICHLGVTAGGSPTVIPTAYGRIGDTLYVHGSVANQAITAAAGRPACVTVTHFDGLVLARSVFHHSVNYRSAVIYGTPRLVTGDQQRLDALRAIVDHLAPGQWETARALTRKEMAATAVLAMPLAEASVKVRSGPPADDAEDYRLGVWAGVLPVHVVFGEPQADPQLPPGVAAPAHVRGRSRRPVAARTASAAPAGRAGDTPGHGPRDPLPPARRHEPAITDGAVT